MPISDPGVRYPHAFVSYRQGDVPAQRGVVERLATLLKQDLGSRAVYFAPTDNSLGEDYAERILAEIGRSDAVLAIIGPRWEHGNDVGSGIARAGDWVRRELSTAIADESTDLIPLLVDRDRSPDEDELPADIRRVATTQGIVRFTIDDHYQSVLTQVWASFTAHLPHVRLVIADATDKGTADVESFVAAARSEGTLDDELLRRLSQVMTSPPGMALLPLKQLAEAAPDIIVLEPESPTDAWRQRLAGAQAYAQRHTLVALVAPSAAAASALGFAAASQSWHTTAFGWFQGLSTVGKGAVVAGTAAATVGTASLVALTGDDPIPLMGTWDVTEFNLEAGGNTIADGLLEADRFVFEPADASCTEPGCALIATEGPGALQGVEMVADGSTYTSTELSLTRSCGGEPVPDDTYTSALVVEPRDGSDDELVFSIVIDSEAYANCDASTVTYEAVASRVG